MKSKPYVGVTGPTSVAEVNVILNAFAEAGYSMDSPHLPMIGFLISHKTLNGQPTENRRYPQIKDLRPMLEACREKAFTTLHFNSREPKLMAQIAQLLDHDGVYIDGLCRAMQLNIVEPRIDKSLFYNRPELQIIFQANRHVLMKEDGYKSGEFVDRSPQSAVDEIKKYLGLIRYVLIDPSGGQGKDFNLEPAAAIFRDAKWQLPGITMGFAGGLTGFNVEQRVAELSGKLGTDDFSIDAEGGLRDKLSDRYGDDLLNPEKVRAYIKAASKVLP